MLSNDFSNHLTIHCLPNGYIRRVKQFVLFFALLVQSFGFVSADAKLTASPHTYVTAESNTVSVASDDDTPDIHRIFKLSRSAFKIRVSRSFASTPEVTKDIAPRSVGVIQKTAEYKSPFYLPLVRLLLFPKHYFW
jgi:hypothetical protein